MGFIATVIVYGVMTIGVGTMNGDYSCPVFYDDKTEWVNCYTVKTQYCEDLGCERVRYSCGKPACNCRGITND